jgi:hypothetical protein
MKHRDGEYEAILKAVAEWSVGINCAIARLARVRDQVHKDLVESKHMRENPPWPNGLPELMLAISEFEDANFNTLGAARDTPRE